MLSILLCFPLLHTQKQGFSSAQWQETLSHGAVGFQVSEMQTDVMAAPVFL